tara:strand:- start:1129 stop:1734 length:606 start_codon:yes stop_codon:yes gene_type:complete
MKNNIEITNSAEVYLKKLIDAKDEDNLGIRIFIDRPGTPKAETCLAFCNIKEASKDDLVMHLELIDVYVDSKSIDFLKDAIVNYDEDNFDGQLTIKAPNAKMPNIGENSTIEDKINFILYNEINPMLASHGGEVFLVEFTEDSDVILQFGGGCQGCGMIDVTLKDGIETTLIEQIPEIRSVKDITDHSIDENAYYPQEQES